MEEKPKRKSHIEELKEKLYNPKSKVTEPKERGSLYEEDYEVPKKWKKDPIPKVKKHKNLLSNSIFRKMFFGALIFFSLSVVFGVIMFFGGSNTVSADNIKINVLGNAFVSGGEELPLKIEILNRNNVPLEYVDLLLEYQKGAGAGESIQRDRFTVGTIPAGGRVEELVNLVLFGQQGTTRDINITLEYRVKGSSAIFIKPELYVVNISSAPINLLVEGPDVTSTNQEISFDIITSLNTENVSEDMMVVVDYPPGFDFESATPRPTFSDNIWSLGDLSPGAEKKITVNGVVAAESGEERAFNVFVGRADPEDEQRIGTQFNSQNYIVAIEKPFLDISLTVNGSGGPESVAFADRVTEGNIRFTNNLDTKITDVEIIAEFSGNVFDIDEISPRQGFLDTNTQSVIWNKQTKNSLGTIDPGDTEELVFNFSPLPFSETNIENPEININLSIRGRQPSLGNSFQNIDNVVKKKVKYSTNFQIAGHALHNSGPIQNSGPLPPTPGQPTTYTIVWSLANTTNDVVNARAKTTLPLYVDWTGAISPANQDVTYNSATREVVWNIGNVSAGVGNTSAPKQVNFQVRLNPSGSQSGSVVNLILNTVLTGKDAFTDVDINKNIPSVNTRLNRDSNYNPQYDSVQ